MRIIDAASKTESAHPTAKLIDEDMMLMSSQPPVFAVADGMGGPGIGDIAAQIAIDALIKRSTIIERLAKATESDRASGARLALGRMLERTFSEVHNDVLDAAQRQNEPAMGTTLLATVICGGYATIAHIGASRAYLLRDGKLELLTVDHTLGALRVKQGLMSEDALRTSPLRDRLYQALGTGSDVDVDIASLCLADQDVLLLCSDGVHRSLDEATLKAALQRSDAAESVEALLQAARERGSSDDRTAIVIRIAADASAEDIAAMARAIASTAIFSDLNGAEHLLIAPYLDTVSLQPGDVLFEEGQPADSFYVIVEGKLRVTRGGTPLTEISAGGSLGELCLAGSRQTRSASAIVLAPLVAFRLTRERFLEVVARRPSIGNRMLSRALSLVGDRLRDLTERLAVVEKLAVGESKPGEVPLRTAIILATRGEWE